MFSEEIKEALLSQWAKGRNLDSRLEYYHDNFERWINQIPKEYRELILQLLKELHYFTRSEANRILKELHSELIKTYGISDENTIYTFIKSKDGETNSSIDYWTEYKNINNINRHLCFENINAIEKDKWQFIENIVFIYDFSGTGQSIKKELMKHLDFLSGKTVFIIVVSLMNNSKSRMERFGDCKGFKVIWLYGECREKAFKLNMFENNQEASAKYNILANQIGIFEHLGRDNTQALVAFYNNTPNNTLGFVHCKSKKYFPIFPRRIDKRPSWQSISKEDEQRKKANYNNLSSD